MKNEVINYYTLKQLSPIVELTYNHLKLRVKDIIKKYADDKALITKKSNIWYIHQSIINEFEPIRKPIKYKYFITIASRNKLELKYWKFCISDLNIKLKQIEPTTRTKYVVETTRNNTYHIHIITSFSNYEILNKMLNNNQINNFFAYMNIDIQKIYLVSGLHRYFRKQNKPVLLK